MGEIKAVLFDMDGVLFDSMPNHAYSWSHAMTQFGLAMTTEEAYMNEGRTGGGTIDILAQRFWHRDATQEEKEHIYAAKTALFNQLPEAKPMPGALKALQAVKDHGWKIVLVTGSGQVTLLDRLSKHFPGFFSQDLMVTSFDVKQGKPHPEPYLMGLAKAGVRAEEALVVENAPLGTRAAKAAGLFTCAVNTGILPDSDLEAEHADKVFPDMASLLKWLQDSAILSV